MYTFVFAAVATATAIIIFLFFFYLRKIPKDNDFSRWLNIKHTIMMSTYYGTLFQNDPINWLCEVMQTISNWFCYILYALCVCVLYDTVYFSVRTFSSVDSLAKNLSLAPPHLSHLWHCFTVLPEHFSLFFVACFFLLCSLPPLYCLYTTFTELSTSKSRPLY